jgi:aspartoacylase
MRFCHHSLLFLLLVFISSYPLIVTSTGGSSTNIMPSSKIESVAIIGGTHGNEYTGVYCIKALERKLERNGKSSYPFQLTTLIGNPEAFQRNKRFVDHDLNRCFSHKALTEAVATKDLSTLTLEQKRSLELDSILGPKFDENRPPKMDFIVDLHTTTTNMHTSLIIGQGNLLTTQAAAYVMHKSKFKVCILMHTHISQSERPHVSSIAPNSYTIEVGPG